MRLRKSLKYQMIQDKEIKYIKKPWLGLQAYFNISIIFMLLKSVISMFICCLIDFIFSGVVGRPPFPPATTSMSSFTASGGMPEYYQSPGGHYGTNQSESMQVAENSSEVMGNIRQKKHFQEKCPKSPFFFCI